MIMIIKHVNLYTLVFSLFLFNTCGKGIDVSPNGQQPPKKEVVTPAISSLQPNTATVGEEITITGSNFGKDASALTVLFDKSSAKILKLEDNAIQVVVPDIGAGKQEKAIFVNVSNKEKTSNKTPFTYNKVKIDSIPNTKGLFGEVITIYGSGFGDNKDKNIVYFNEQTATILDASKRLLKVVVPKIYDNQAAIRVANSELERQTNLYIYKYNIAANDSIGIVDSLASQNVAEGIIWKKSFSNIFNSNQSINVVEVDLNANYSYSPGIAYSTTTFKKTSSFCMENDAIVGVNGSYYETGGSKDFLKVNGVVINVGRPDNWSEIINAAFVFNSSGISLIKLANGNITAASLKEDNILVSGPMLVQSGKSLSFLHTGTHTTSRHPRTAIGITEDNKILFVTVDGRYPSKAAGMSMKELGFLLRILGAKDAMNLDGGGSTTLYIKDHGVVNYPSDNEKFDHAGERSVANAIYMK